MPEQVRSAECPSERSERLERLVRRCADREHSRRDTFIKLEGIQKFPKAVR